MLTEKQINPYSTWESEYPKLVEDDRYTVLSTTKHRREVFTTWCRDHIAELKLEKAKERKIDPRVSFWNFLTAHATPKLYWAEFKRKFRKEPEMKDLKVTDKEREKMYRDYLAHIKISPAIRENDLKKLLKSTISLTHSTPLDDLPIPILIDVRYVTAPQPLREEIIREYIESLPNNMTPAERKEKEERQRKEAALRDRESAVRREQARLRGEIGRGRELLREEEAAIERAKVVGKKGLMSQIMVKKEDGEDAAKPVRAAEDGP